MTQRREVSDETNKQIDLEVRKIIDGAYERAKAVLKEQHEKLNLMAEALIKYETIDEVQIKEIMQGKAPSPPAGWEENYKAKNPVEEKIIETNEVKPKIIQPQKPSEAPST